jgi:hypothetical protein
MSPEKYALLRTFRSLFQGKPYLHRKSNLGDLVASHLYEDLASIAKSSKLVERVQHHERVVNVRNIMTGKPGRRGDGTFGELVPAAIAITEKGMLVARGPVATIEIGAETKILAKAMIKQIDRVITDLANQVSQFKRGGGNPISVGFIGINLPTNMYPSKAASAGRPTERNTSIQSKKPRKRSNAYPTRRGQLSTSSSFFGFGQPTRSLIRLIGSIWRLLNWNILLC